jgi:hypothetical protein
VVELSVSEAESQQPAAKPFPWWIIGVIAGVLCAGGIILGIILNKPDPQEPEPKPEPEITIVVPPVIGKKYEEAFNMLNEKKIIYQVFINQKKKNEIDRKITDFNRPTRRTLTHVAESRLMAVRKIESLIPVVENTDPLPGAKIKPTDVVKVYLGKPDSNYQKLTARQVETFVKEIEKIKKESN